MWHFHRRLVIWVIVYLLITMAVVGLIFDAASEVNVKKLPVGYIDLIVPQLSYKVGEPVHFTITNHLSATIYLDNKCPNEPLSVYRMVNNSWVQVHDKSDINSCHKQQRKIAIPEESSISGSYANWPNLFKQPGRYKIVANINHYNGYLSQELLIIQVDQSSGTKATPAKKAKPLPTNMPTPIVTPTPTSTPSITEEPQEEDD